MYINSFQDALMNQPVFSFNLENFIPKNKLKHDLRNQLEDISNELKSLSTGLEGHQKDILQQVLNILLKS